MAKQSNSNARGRIIEAAWDLFYDKGFENTTIEEILTASGTSRGSFYHYFNGKDDLPGSVSYLFDEKYTELKTTLDPTMNAFDKLMFLNRELFGMIERRVPIDLLSRLLSSQLTTRGERRLMDHDRVYFRLLRQIISEGQDKGELRSDISVSELVKTYALCERGLMYDWCLVSGEYSLRDYSSKMLPVFMEFSKL